MHMQDGGHNHGQHGNSHAGILTALGDCQAVLARGMGRRIYDDLRGANIESIITNQATVDDALAAYLAGNLDDNPEQGCEH